MTPSARAAHAPLAADELRPSPPAPDSRPAGTTPPAPRDRDRSAAYRRYAEAGRRARVSSTPRADHGIVSRAALAVSRMPSSSQLAPARGARDPDDSADTPPRGSGAALASAPTARANGRFRCGTRAEAAAVTLVVAVTVDKERGDWDEGDASVVRRVDRGSPSAIVWSVSRVWAVALNSKVSPAPANPLRMVSVALERNVLSAARIPPPSSSSGSSRSPSSSRRWDWRWNGLGTVTTPLRIADVAGGPAAPAYASPA